MFERARNFRADLGVSEDLEFWWRAAVAGGPASPTARGSWWAQPRPRQHHRRKRAFAPHRMMAMDACEATARAAGARTCWPTSTTPASSACIDLDRGLQARRAPGGGDPDVLGGPAVRLDRRHREVPWLRAGRPAPHVAGQARSRALTARQGREAVPGCARPRRPRMTSWARGAFGRVVLRIERVEVRRLAVARQELLHVVHPGRGLEQAGAESARPAAEPVVESPRRGCGTARTGTGGRAARRPAGRGRSRDGCRLPVGRGSGADVRRRYRFDLSSCSSPGRAACRPAWGPPAAEACPW